MILLAYVPEGYKILCCSVSHIAWLSCPVHYYPDSEQAALGVAPKMLNAHSAVWLPRCGDLLFELLADLGSNRVIVHDAVELLAGGPDYTGLNILVH